MVPRDEQDEGVNDTCDLTLDDGWLDVSRGRGDQTRSQLLRHETRVSINEVMETER